MPIQEAKGPFTKRVVKSLAGLWGPCPTRTSLVYDAGYRAVRLDCSVQDGTSTGVIGRLFISTAQYHGDDSSIMLVMI